MSATSWFYGPAAWFYSATAVCYLTGLYFVTKRNRSR